jgi:AraC family transcriptional regulator of adaptative response/methylated-DNA-[protein]-cysteine methyltransferase
MHFQTLARSRKRLGQAAGVSKAETLSQRDSTRSPHTFLIRKQAPERGPSEPMRKCISQEMKETVMDTLTARHDATAENIRLAFGTCSLGTILVATSSKGVAAILLGDNPDVLRRELDGAFPHARATLDAAGLEDLVTQVAAFIEAPHNGLDLTLDIRGSALEQAVWQALREVPAGHTVTYGQIAKTLAISATAQDVGAACAANVLAVAIPCHRVVKADGSISGYRWGVQRKRKLINREGVA